MDDNNGTSLFERLYYTAQVEVVTLLVQHRMPACIASFPSQQYYGGKLETANDWLSAPPQGFRWPTDDPICFINEHGEGEQRREFPLQLARSTGSGEGCGLAAARWRCGS